MSKKSNKEWRESIRNNSFSDWGEDGELYEDKTYIVEVERNDTEKPTLTRIYHKRMAIDERHAAHKERKIIRKRRRDYPGSYWETAKVLAVYELVLERQCDEPLTEEEEA